MTLLGFTSFYPTLYLRNSSRKWCGSITHAAILMSDRILALSKQPGKQYDSPYLQMRKTPVIMTQY
ncbi:hypothetical protein [Nostoc sp.]|uniref:hypothetical protein n=1 Tax=Nostoc sp. TaxID=1180 RepID=UPI002FF4B936